MPTLKPDEIRRLIESGQINTVPGAQMGLSLIGPDYERNRWCGLCGVEVQISPRGRQQLDAGGAVVVCNPCRIELEDIKQKQGRREVKEIKSRFTDEYQALLNDVKQDASAMGVFSIGLVTVFAWEKGLDPDRALMEAAAKCTTGRAAVDLFNEWLKVYAR